MKGRFYGSKRTAKDAQKSIEYFQQAAAIDPNYGLAFAGLAELKERYAKRQANGYDLARVYLGLGEKDQVFAWLEKDFQSRSATMPSFLYFPPLDSLRDDPRYKDLARRIGLPELK